MVNTVASQSEPPAETGTIASEREALALTFGSSVAVVGGASLLYPVLTAVAADLRVAEEEIGLMMSAFFLPAILLSPVFGVIADLRGRRRVLIFGLALFGAAGSAAALAPSWEWVIGLRALQGVGMSAMSPLTIVLISDLLPPERELRGQGLKVVFDRIGMIVLPLAGGALALISWRLSFLVFALTIPMAVFAWLRMPETMKPGSDRLGRYLRRTMLAVRQPRLIIAYGTGFLRFFLDTGLYTYLPLLLALRYQASPAIAGLLIAVSAGGSIATAASIGRFRQVRAEWMLSSAFLASAAAMFPVALGAPLPVLFAATFLFGLCNGIISPLQKSLLTQRTEPSLRGAVVSADRVIQQIGKAVAPLLMGLLLLVAPFEWIFWSLCLASGAGAAALLASGLSARHRGSGL